MKIALEKFFDLVNHDRLISRLIQRIIEDKDVQRLIRRYLICGATESGVKRKVKEGTPQGGPLSLMLSNIVTLDELDKKLEKRQLRFLRYAGDVSIFVGGQNAYEWGNTPQRLLANCTVQSFKQ